MQIDTFVPQNEDLQKHIERIYILEHSQEEDEISYLTFPSNNSIVAAVKNAKNSINKNHITTEYSNSNSLETSLVCKFNLPICFKYRGDIKEICIYFKPLGLNAFLEKQLANYCQTFFDPFLPFTDYETEMKKILDIENKDLLIANLEKYWLGKINGFDHQFLIKAIAEIDQNPKITTLELANKYKISQKTLISEFKKHLCKTPSEYKKIMRFRRTVKYMQSSIEETKLTELSNIIDFFDQSHMINDFKSLTGYTPKLFFKHLVTVENGKIYWIFI